MQTGRSRDRKRPRQRRRQPFLILIPALFSLLALPAPAETLRVGINGEPPFLLRRGRAGIEGLAIAYWEHLSSRIGREYTFVEFSSVDESLAALSEGKIDLAIGDITISFPRIREFDFTEPIAQEQLTLLLPGSPPSLWSTIRSFLGWAFLSSIGGIYLCLLIVGNLLWLTEHRQNPHFPQEYRKGFAQGVWCALVTLTTVGYDDVIP